MKKAVNLLLLLIAILLFVTGETDISGFGCDTFLTCTDCISSESKCHWCVGVGVHICTSDIKEDCPNNILITGNDKNGSQSEPGSCPAMISSDGEKEIFVPFGTTKDIKVKVHITSSFIIQTRFSCQFINLDGHVDTVNARLLGDTIYCDSKEFSYDSKSANLTIPFAVMWGGNHPLDNNENIRVVVFKCKEMANNCETCLSLSENYNCGWCQSKSACEYSEHCSLDDRIDRKHIEMCPKSKYVN